MPDASPSTLTQIAALGGLTFGSAGLALSLANFFRDRHRLRITLRFDMTPTDSALTQLKTGLGGGSLGLAFSKPLVACVTIANIGRRPVFLSHVALCMPRRMGKKPNLLFGGTVRGTRLAEGDPPWLVWAVQDVAMDMFAAEARFLRAVVVDSANKLYYSPLVQRPAKKQGAGAGPDGG